MKFHKVGAQPNAEKQNGREFFCFPPKTKQEIHHRFPFQANENSREIVVLEAGLSPYRGYVKVTRVFGTRRGNKKKREVDTVELVYSWQLSVVDVNSRQCPAVLFWTIRSPFSLRLTFFNRN